MLRKHPTVLIKVLVAGAPSPRPAQHFLCEGRRTDGDVAATYVHVHAEHNMESLKDANATETPSTVSKNDQEAAVYSGTKPAFLNGVSMLL